MTSEGFSIKDWIRHRPRLYRTVLRFLSPVSYSMWNEIYTQERVAELRGQARVHKPPVLRAV